MHGKLVEDASYHTLKDLLTGMNKCIAQLEKEIKEKPQLLSWIVALEKRLLN